MANTYKNANLINNDMPNQYKLQFNNLQLFFLYLIFDVFDFLHDSRHSIAIETE